MNECGRGGEEQRGSIGDEGVYERHQILASGMTARDRVSRVKAATSLRDEGASEERDKLTASLRAGEVVVVSFLGTSRAKRIRISMEVVA